MKKVAIVGVEGSGKTVMLAGLGDLYSRPDEEGYFLGPKNFQTVKYVAEKVARMRCGEWPMATAEDVMQGLDWTLRQRQSGRRRPKDVCEVSCLDFAGEVYRYAFVRTDAVPEGLVDEVQSLKDYVRNADDLIVLINLRDIIVWGEHDSRVQEAMWITNAILSYALDEQPGRDVPRAAIVLSQADSYAQTIKSCGGPTGVLAKYLPHVANNYDWLDILAVSAVDKTVQDENGNMVPAPDFTSAPLRKVMDWIRGVKRDDPPQPATGSGSRPKDKPPPVKTPKKKVNGFVFALTMLAGGFSAFICLMSGHWGMSIFLGFLVVTLPVGRGEGDTKYTVLPWFACALFLVAAGIVGCTGHWILASIVSIVGIGIVIDEKDKK